MPSKITFGVTSEQSTLENSQFNTIYKSLVILKEYIFVLGIVCHEISHYIICKLLGIEIYTWSLFNSHSTESGVCFGYFTYENPNQYYKEILINTAPLYINIPLGIVLLLVLDPTGTLTVYNTLSLWLIVSIFAKSIPSSGDISNIHFYRKHDIGVSIILITYPLDKLAQLQLYYGDVVFAVVLMYILL